MIWKNFHKGNQIHQGSHLSTKHWKHFTFSSLTSTGGEIERNKSTIVDPDSLTTILQYLSALEVANLRSVSKVWNQICSSNSVWKHFCQRDFGMTEKNIVDMERSASVPNFWFCYYSTILSCIPVIVQQEPEKEPSLQSRYFAAYDSYQDEDDYYKYDEEVSEMKLLCDPGMVDYNVHRLCGILGLLNCNDYVPKTRSHSPHPMLVGTQEASPCAVIPLLKICYAILNGTDLELLKQHRGPIRVDGVDEEATEDNFIFSEDVAVSPFIDGPFSPFVFLNETRGTKTDAEKLDFQIEVDEDNVYLWESKNQDWAPVFFNASFRWLYECKMITSYLEDCRMVRVTKLIERTPD